jgi:hypothetical protein
MMRHDDINFAAYMTGISDITNYLLTASIGGGTFYGEVIQESLIDKRQSRMVKIRPWRIKNS